MTYLAAAAPKGGGSSPFLCGVPCESPFRKTVASTCPPKCSGIELLLDTERRFCLVSCRKLHAGRAQVSEARKAGDARCYWTEEERK